MRATNKTNHPNPSAKYNTVLYLDSMQHPGLGGNLILLIRYRVQVVNYASNVWFLLPHELVEGGL